MNEICGAGDQIHHSSMHNMVLRFAGSILYEQIGSVKIVDQKKDLTIRKAE